MDVVPIIIEAEEGEGGEGRREDEIGSCVDGDAYPAALL